MGDTWEQSQKYIMECIKETKQDLSDIYKLIDDLKLTINKLSVDLSIIQTKLIFLMIGVSFVSSTVTSVIVMLIKNWVGK